MEVALNTAVERAVRGLRAGKLIVGVAGLTVTFCEATPLLYSEVPGTEAVRVQVPAVKKVAVVPDTVQTLDVVEAKVIGPFDGAVALSVAVVSAVCGPRAVKLMVWVASVTVVDLVALAAVK